MYIIGEQSKLDTYKSSIVTSSDCQNVIICQHKRSFEVHNYSCYDVQHCTLKKIILCFNIQEKDIIEHINAKCYVFTLTINVLTVV